MRRCIAILSLYLLGVVSAYAGAGHSHGHEQMTRTKPEIVAKMANKKLMQLIKKGKLDKSWKGKTAIKVEQKSFAKGPEWVVVFRNQEHKMLAKRTLFMFYTLDGKYIAANFTGN